MNDDGTRQFRVTVAQICFADAQVTAASKAEAIDLVRQGKVRLEPKFKTELYATRTEIIARVIDNQPVWIDAE